MSNLVADGIAHYGRTATNGFFSAPTILANLLAGAWAEAPNSTSNGITTLPWDTADTDVYLYNFNTPIGFRRVFPAGAVDPAIVSLYYATDALPGLNNYSSIISFRDGSNVVMAELFCQTTGVLALYDTNGVLLASTTAPVIVAESAVHLEMKLTQSSGSFKLNVNETTVINVTGLTFTGSGHAAQIALLKGPNAGHGAVTQYATNIIMRDTAGSVNNDIVGDRRVATLFVDADDLAHQGWAARPRLRFGAGILDNRANTTSGVTAASTTDTNLGSGDFTIEGSYRFLTLPSGSNKAVLFGKWDETHNKRSYQFYMGGPSLESGNTVFRISTDGAAGTVTEIFSWPWAPETDNWYHLAVVRTAGEVLFFVDGVQQGLPAADANTYCAGTETTALGVQDDSGSQITNTGFNGFVDEFRLSVGYARYTSGFSPPVAAFPRGSGSDAHWSSVAWLSGFDSGVFDESGFARTLTALNGAVMLTPDDGVSNFQCLDKPTPFDDTFIEAALLSATGVLTQTAQPTNNKIVTLGDYGGGPTTAVYTWKTTLTGAAFEVKIGATLQISLANFVAAVNAAAGAGTLYGTGTTANNKVTASMLPVEQVLATANAPGTAGNAVVSTTNDTNGSWGAATLTGGANIPAYSQFSFQRPPNQTTIIDSITLVTRSYKTDSGTANVQAAFVGAGGGVANGANNPITTVPTLYHDTIETDPDTSAALSPTSIINGKVRVNRTA